MASRNSTLIELTDIIAFNLMCSECHYSVTIPRTSDTLLLATKKPLTCRGCGTVKESVLAKNQEGSLLQLQQELKNIEEALSPNLSFSLEIKKEALELLTPHVTIKA